MYRVFEYLNKHDVEHKRKIKLSNVSSIKIGGIAEAIAYPKTEDALIGLLNFLLENKMPYKIFGRMTNILPRDEGYGGVLISTVYLNFSETKDETVLAGAGTSLSSLIFSEAKLGLGGLESLFGIPGTLGGALHNNGGALGFEIANSILGVKVYSPKENKVLWLDNPDMKFAYRSSVFDKEDYVALSAIVAMKRKSYHDIITEIKDVREKRKNSQPLSHPSLGSVFKRENGVAVSRLIDAAGLKGMRVGGAEISKKHAGFIINRGGASCHDVLSLIDKVKNTINEKYGFIPQEEIEIL